MAMADQWILKSEAYDNCNCAINCGCQFNLPSTYGYCQSAYVATVVEGHFNDTPLAGLNWAALLAKSPRVMAGVRLLSMSARTKRNGWL
jgi:hypothetical protein